MQQSAALLVLFRKYLHVSNYVDLLLRGMFLLLLHFSDTLPEFLGVFFQWLQQRCLTLSSF